MEWMKLIGFCLLAAMLVMLLRQMNPAAAGLLAAAFGVLTLGVVLPQIYEYIRQIHALLSALRLDAPYYAVLLKAMGIALVTQFAVQVCQDMGAESIARRAEFCGRIALLGVAAPVFMSLTQMAVDALS